MFIDRSALLADNPAQWYEGMAVVDLDSDGQFECYIAAQGGRNLVLKWGGDSFFDVGITPLTADRETSMGVAAGDADGDGREELFVSSGEGSPDRLFAWRNGHYIDLLHDHIRQSSQSALALDRFGMGRYGFLVAHEGGPFRYYEVLGGDRIAELGAELGLARIAGGRGLVAAPLSGSKLEIYAANEGISSMLFRAATAGTYQEVAANHGLAAGGRGVAVIDANHDGRLDLIVGSQLRLQGAQRMFSAIELDPPSNTRAVVVADFDNDGHEEIFVANQNSESYLYGWRDWNWKRLPCPIEGSLVGAVVGDWDQDGCLELLVTEGERQPGPIRLFHAEPNRNHWLRIAPLTAAGAPARGATVRIAAGGREQIRVIDSGSGYLCQHEPVAHFGLGDCSTIDWLEVQWPDGTLRRFPSMPGDRLLSVRWG